MASNSLLDIPNFIDLNPSSGGFELPHEESVSNVALKKMAVIVEYLKYFILKLC